MAKNGRFWCKKCGKKFSTLKELQEHQDAQGKCPDAQKKRRKSGKGKGRKSSK